MPLEDGLDLTGLDAEAADLELPVGAAEELDVAVGEPARQVAGAVEAGARAEGVGDEALRRAARPVQVAEGDAGAADAQLSRIPIGTSSRFESSR